MQRYERWIGGFRGQAERGDLAGVGVESVGVDAFALAAFFGVGADVEKYLPLPSARAAEARSVERRIAESRTIECNDAEFFMML